MKKQLWYMAISVTFYAELLAQSIAETLHEFAKEVDSEVQVIQRYDREEGALRMYFLLEAHREVGFGLYRQLLQECASSQQPVGGWIANGPIARKAWGRVKINGN